MAESGKTIQRSVLIVEDEDRLRELLMRVAQKLGYHVSGASTGERAIEMMGESPRDILILDLKLPGMDGMAAYEHVRQHWPGTCVIILTAYGSLETAQQAIRYDVVDFLTKPCRLDEVRQALEKAERRIANSAEQGESDSTDSVLADTTIEESEYRLIMAALARHDGNRSAAARELGISRRTLYNRIAAYTQQGLWNKD